MKKDYFTFKIHKADGVVHIVSKESTMYAFPNHRKLKYKTINVPYEKVRNS